MAGHVIDRACGDIARTVTRGCSCCYMPRKRRWDGCLSLPACGMTTKSAGNCADMAYGRQSCWTCFSDFLVGKHITRIKRRRENAPKDVCLCRAIFWLSRGFHKRGPGRTRLENKNRHSINPCGTRGRGDIAACSPPAEMAGPCVPDTRDEPPLNVH